MKNKIEKKEVLERHTVHEILKNIMENKVEKNEYIDLIQDHYPIISSKKFADELNNEILNEIYGKYKTTIG
jgi:hypothetical protein